MEKLLILQLRNFNCRERACYSQSGDRRNGNSANGCNRCSWRGIESNQILVISNTSNMNSPSFMRNDSQRTWLADSPPTLIRSRSAYFGCQPAAFFRICFEICHLLDCQSSKWTQWLLRKLIDEVKKKVNCFWTQASTSTSENETSKWRMCDRDRKSSKTIEKSTRRSK